MWVPVGGRRAAVVFWAHDAHPHHEPRQLGAPDPIAPFAHAALRAGHEVLAAVQEANSPTRGGSASRRRPFPPASARGLAPADGRDDGWQSFDDANRAMLAEYFGRLDTEHALPELRRIVQGGGPT